MFHCSLLKPFHHSKDIAITPLPLPAKSIDNQPVLTPLVILSTRWQSFDTEPKLQVLVQWEGLTPDDTSWEDWELLKSDCHLENKVFFHAEGNDRKKNLQGKNTNLRPKRITTPPKYLQDFV